MLTIQKNENRLITVSGVLPPGTLIVERVPDMTSIVPCRVPSLNMRFEREDFKSGSGELYSGGGIIRSTWAKLYNGSIDANSLINLVAYGGRILPMNNPCNRDNCTFSTSFAGPSIKCEDLPIDFEGAPWVVRPWNRSNPLANPGYRKLSDRPLTYLGQQDGDANIWLQWSAVNIEDMQYTNDGIPFRRLNFTNGDDGDRRTDRYAAKCLSYNTSYELDVEVRAGTPTVTNIKAKYLEPIDYRWRNSVDYNLTLPKDALKQSYPLNRALGLMDALFSEFLSGDIGMSADDLHGFRYDIDTKLITTPLSQEWVIQSGKGVNITSYHPVRGLSTAIEELSRNITISILGRPNILVKTTKEGKCTELHDINAYKFDARTFWASYSAGLLLGLIAVIVGSYCLIMTEVARDDGFSDIAATTMDRDLNAIMAAAEKNGNSDVRVSAIKVRFDSGFKLLAK